MLLITLLVAVCLFSTSYAATCRCGRPPSSERIVGGYTAPAPIPWLASIRTFVIYKNLTFSEYICGGSLINDEWVLTAAHCFESKTPYPDADQVFTRVSYAIFGRVDLRLDITPDKLFYFENRNGQILVHDANVLEYVYSAENALWHENYNKYNFVNDIALLHLKRPVQLSPRVYPICLPPFDVNFPDLHLAGWGNVGTNVSNGMVLQAAEIDQFPIEVCQQFYHYNPVDGNYQICINPSRRSPCFGDSGGPYMKNNNGIFYVMAIVSYGSDCETTPGVALKVAPYKEWIMNTAKTGNWCV